MIRLKEPVIRMLEAMLYLEESNARSVVSDKRLECGFWSSSARTLFSPGF